MLISESTAEKLNGLVTKTFQMNSFCDNIAYNLDSADLPEVSKIFHLHFAHKFPEFADTITDMMAELDTRAIRGSLSENSEYYGENIEAMFTDVRIECEKYRNAITDVLDVAEINEDYEVKISLENFLLEYMPYYKQARVWEKYAKRFGNDNIKSFEVHFGDFTTHIGNIG